MAGNISLKTLCISLLIVGVATSNNSFSDGKTNKTASIALQDIRLMAQHPQLNVVSFRSMDDIYPTENVAHVFKKSLVKHEDIALKVTLDDRSVSLDEALLETKTNGFVVLNKGKIVYERYFNDANYQSQFISYSTSKSLISVLVGICLDEGLIADVNDPLHNYLPRLNNTAYEGVTIRQMLMMRSGTSYTEAYESDVESDLRKVFIMSLVKNDTRFTDFSSLGLTKKYKPGTVFNYSTMETGILGELIERVSGKRLAQFTEDKIWKPVGMEHDAYWLLDGKHPEGLALAGGGLNAVSRDFARFGQLMLDQGRANGVQVVSKAWVRESVTLTSPGPVTQGGERGYQYQWWVDLNSNAYMAIGIHGQFIYIDPDTETVIVKNSFWETPESTDLDEKTMKIFKAITGYFSK